MSDTKHLSPDEDRFARHVAEALDQIPKEFRDRMENVEILVEDFPDQATIESMGLNSKWDLLGLYVGVPLSNRSVFSTAYLPETIILYRRPILRAAMNEANLPHVVRDVIVHELGHHFGFSDAELYSMTGPEE
jgi:predicted Zn-dependent protease with MMP-like domain